MEISRQLGDTGFVGGPVLGLVTIPTLGNEKFLLKEVSPFPEGLLSSSSQPAGQHSARRVRFGPWNPLDLGPVPAPLWTCFIIYKMSEFG